MTKLKINKPEFINKFFEVSSLAEILDEINWQEDIDTVDIQQYTYDEKKDHDTYVILINGQTAGFLDGPL